MKRLLILAAFLATCAPALAQSDNALSDDALCVDRPGLGAPACVLPKGQAMAELGLLGWDHRADAASVADELAYGDLLLRYGLGSATEIELGIEALGTERVRDRASGTVERVSGVGDVTLALRHNLSGGDGPMAVHAYVTLPTGRDGIGAGDWGAGVLVPIELPLGAGFELGLTPEVDAAVNASGRGRHLAWGGVVGLGHDLTRSLSAEAEIAAWRDQDPEGHATDARAALSLAWRVAADWQLDAEVELGLTSAAPRHSVFFGLARRFR